MIRKSPCFVMSWNCYTARFHFTDLLVNVNFEITIFSRLLGRITYTHSYFGNSNKSCMFLMIINITLLIRLLVHTTYTLSTDALLSTSGINCLMYDVGKSYSLNFSYWCDTDGLFQELRHY